MKNLGKIAATGLIGLGGLGLIGGTYEGIKSNAEFKQFYLRQNSLEKINLEEVLNDFEYITEIEENEEIRIKLENIYDQLCKRHEESLSQNKIYEEGMRKTKYLFKLGIVSFLLSAAVSAFNEDYGKSKGHKAE